MPPIIETDLTTSSTVAATSTTNNCINTLFNNGCLRRILRMIEIPFVFLMFVGVFFLISWTVFVANLMVRFACERNRRYDQTRAIPLSINRITQTL